MSRKPWDKWYPQRWLSEPSLRLCSREARSFWLDCLCLMMMADSHRLEVDGAPPTVAELSNLLGDDPRTVRRLLAELRERRVYDVDSDGFIISRKRRDDAEKAARDRANGRKGGNPALRSLPEDPAEVRPEFGVKLGMECDQSLTGDASKSNGLPEDGVNPPLNARDQRPETRVVLGGGGGRASDADLLEILAAAKVDPTKDVTFKWQGPTAIQTIARWRDLGLTQAEIVATIAETMGGRAASPQTLAYFTPAMQRVAGLKAAPPLAPIIPDQPTATGGSPHARRPSPDTRSIDALNARLERLAARKS